MLRALWVRLFIRKFTNFELCRKCKGSGKVTIFYVWKGNELQRSKTFADKVNCPTCNGKGFTDWVSNILRQ